MAGTDTLFCTLLFSRRPSFTALHIEPIAPIPPRMIPAQLNHMLAVIRGWIVCRKPKAIRRGIPPMTTFPRRRHNGVIANTRSDQCRDIFQCRMAARNNANSTNKGSQIINIPGGGIWIGSASTFGSWCYPLPTTHYPLATSHYFQPLGNRLKNRLRLGHSAWAARAATEASFLGVDQNYAVLA